MRRERISRPSLSSATSSGSRSVSCPRRSPSPGDRATFYVPRSDDNPRRGRRLMYMRDLACCANGMAFYSTPSDLVRFALATNPGSVNGELAGGMVMSLMMRRDSGSSSLSRQTWRTRTRPRWRCESGTRSRNRRDESRRSAAGLHQAPHAEPCLPLPQGLDRIHVRAAPRRHAAGEGRDAGDYLGARRGRCRVAGRHARATAGSDSDLVVSVTATTMRSSRSSSSSWSTHSLS